MTGPSSGFREKYVLSSRAYIGMSVLLVAGVTVPAPLLPAYAQDFGVGSLAISLLISAFALGELITDVPAGRLLDRLGRRKVTSVGAAISVLASLVCLTAESLPLLVLGRAFQGVGCSAYIVSATQLVVRQAPPAAVSQHLARFQASLIVGLAIGGGAAGFISASVGRGWVWIGYAAIGLASLLVPLAIDRGDLPREGLRGDAPGRRVARVALHAPRPLPRSTARRPLLAASIAGGAVFMARAGVRNTMLPLHGDRNLGLGEQTIGALILLVMAGNLLALIGIQKVICSLGSRRLLSASLLATAGSVWVLPSAERTLTLGLVCVVLGFGSAYAGIIPMTIAREMVGDRNLGSALGLQRMGLDLGLVIGPPLGGFLLDVKGESSFMILSAIVLAALLLVLRMFPRTNSVMT